MEITGPSVFRFIGSVGESEKDLRAMVVHFVKVCRRRGLKLNDAGKKKAMVLNGEEGLECEVCVGGIRLDHISEFIYLGCILSNEVQMTQNVVRRLLVGRGWKVPLGS